MGKECWINVYQTPLTKTQFLGNVCASRFKANSLASDDIVYRLHVKMKDKPGMSREYNCTFEQLQKFPYLKAFLPHIIKNDGVKERRNYAIGKRTNWMDI